MSPVYLIYRAVRDSSLILGMIIYPTLAMIWMVRKLRVQSNQRMKLMISSPGARIQTIGNRLPTSQH